MTVIDRNYLKTKPICIELGKDGSEEWFGFKKSKFITHIDTLYFTAYVNTTEWNEDGRRKRLVEYLKSKKDLANQTHMAVPACEDIREGIEVLPFYAFAFYTLHFGKKDCFDVFIAETVPNADTTPIVVQIRSQYLWMQGAKRAFDMCCYYLEKAMKQFGFRIDRTQENRVDYAFHTNYIQDPLNFFSEKNLGKMQISNFKEADKHLFITGDKVESDYLALGRRKSNNVFIRCYNKSKEVIEMGYKQFFIPIWEENGLISKFDKYLLEQCFLHRNYNYKEKARCLFYLEHGINEEHKKVIQAMLDKDTPMSDYKLVADCLVPDMTIVCNFEFQTKRKFYYNLDVPRARGLDETDYKANVYNLFELYYSIINKLCHDTIRFVNYKGKYGMMARSDRPTADWWLRLMNAKMFEFNDVHYDMNRRYQVNLSREKQKLSMLGSMGGYSAYGNRESMDISTELNLLEKELSEDDKRYYFTKRKNKEKELRKQGILRTPVQDELDLINTLNDNDIERMYERVY